jgi:hypothetical protein
VVQGNIVRNLVPFCPAGADPDDPAGIGIGVEAETAVSCAAGKSNTNQSRCTGVSRAGKPASAWMAATRSAMTEHRGPFDWSGRSLRRRHCRLARGMRTFKTHQRGLP